MSCHIVMKKIDETDDLVFYHVYEKDLNIEFYAGIDKKNNRINFYDSSKFNDPKMIFDFNEEEGKRQKGVLNNVPTSLIGKTLHKIKVALMDKKFPNIISYVHC